MRARPLAIWWLAVLAIGMYMMPGLAEGPTTIGYEGDFYDSAYGSLSDDVYSMQFAIYDAPEGGVKLWPAKEWVETHPYVVVTHGRFVVSLGSEGYPLTPDVYTGGEVYVQVAVGLPAGHGCGAHEPLPIRGSLQTDRRCTPALSGAAIASVADYLTATPGVERWLLLETGSPGAYLSYAAWPRETKQRLDQIVDCFRSGSPLPFKIPVALAPRSAVMQEAVGYGSLESGVDIYLAQIGHMIYLDMAGLVPWSLATLTDEELSYLLPSSNYFVLVRSGGGLTYQTFMVPGSVAGGQDAGGVLGDPRDTLGFLLAKPEHGAELIGATREETVGNLSEWVHDYLFHWETGFASSPREFFLRHPFLSDRLRRLPVDALDRDVYVAIAGCWSASALLAHLLRSVNIPARAITLSIEDAYYEGEHKGLLVSFGGVQRYLPHSDDLYTGWAEGLRPFSPRMTTGEALWENVWLDADAFSALTSPHPNPDIAARLSWLDSNRYLADASLGMHTYHWWSFVCSYTDVVGCGFEEVECAVVQALQDQQGLTEPQARNWWTEMERSLRHLGVDVCEACDRAAALQAPWCARTGRCDETGRPDRYGMR